MNLYEVYSCQMAFLLHFFWPHTTLYLTDMSLAEQEHAQTRLTDTAAYRLREPAFKKCLMIHESRLAHLTSGLKLPCQRFLIHSYSHA